MDGFEELKLLYRESLTTRRAAIAAERGALAGGAEPEPHVQGLRRHLHQLAGSAGAYGYDEMGQLARDLEKRCAGWLALPAAQRDTGVVLITGLATRLDSLDADLGAAALPPAPVT